MREPTAIHIEIPVQRFLPFRELQPVVETSQLEPVGRGRTTTSLELANVWVSKTVA
jgi:hypothetical protein